MVLTPDMRHGRGVLVQLQCLRPNRTRRRAAEQMLPDARTPARQKNDYLRTLQDSNLRSGTEIDFESIALTTRPSVQLNAEC